MEEQTLSTEEKRILLRLAREAIREGLRQPAALPALDLEELPRRLQEDGATFVTLTLAGNLRGCIGSLVARQPLAVDVRHNALAAAFNDPRFMPLTAAEFPRIKVEVSVLSPSQPLAYDGPDDLLRKLRPGVDGVVLERGWHRATFLPQVWEQLPDPEEFLAHLCYKAGLSPDAWRSSTLKISTYRVEKFAEGMEE